MHQSEGIEHSGPAHRAVLDAVEAGDAEEARAAMEQLLALAVQDESLLCCRPEGEAVNG